MSCGLGYLLGTLFAAVEFWWLSIVWAVLSEVAHKSLVYMSVLLFHSGHLHPVHEGQLADDTVDPLNTLRQAQELAARQAPKKREPGILYHKVVQV